MFDVNNRFWQFLNKMADVVLLTMMFILSCIPIITIGAATTSYLSIVMEMHQDLEGAVYRDYWKRFAKYFKRATAIFLPNLLLIVLLVLDVDLCWQMKSYVGYFLAPVLLVLLSGVLAAGPYVYALISHCECPWSELIRCAGYLAITYLQYSLSMLIMVALCVVMIIMYGWTILLLPALALYQYGRILTWIFRRTPRVQQLLPQEHSLRNVNL